MITSEAIDNSTTTSTTANPDPTTGRYVLATPIATTFRGSDGQERTDTITEVTVRRPVAGDLRIMDKETGDIGKALALLAQLTGLDRRVVDKMGMADFGAVSGAIEAFMPAGLKTGVTF